MQTEVGLLGYWLDIYQRWKLVGLTSLTAAICAFLLSVGLTPIFQATSVFYAPQNIAAPSYLAGGESLAQTPFLPATEEKAASVSLGILRSQDVFRSLAVQFPGRTRSQLQKNVSIEVSREFMIEVTVRDTDPEMAARIANRFPDLLREFQRNQIREHMEAVAAAARSELEAIQSRMARIRSPLNREGAMASPEANDEPLLPEVSGESFQGAADSELRNTAERLRTVLREATTQSRQPAAPVVVVQEAVAADRPAFPLPALNTVVSAVVGMALGAYYALFCGYLDRRRQLRTQRNLTLPRLGDRDIAPLQEAMRSSA